MMAVIMIQIVHRQAHELTVGALYGDVFADDVLNTENLKDNDEDDGNDDDDGDDDDGGDDTDNDC